MLSKEGTSISAMITSCNESAGLIGNECFADNSESKDSKNE